MGGECDGAAAGAKSDAENREMCIRDRTEAVIEVPLRKKYTAGQKEALRAAERLHATLAENSTVRKILAIREQIGSI